MAIEIQSLSGGYIPDQEAGTQSNEEPPAGSPKTLALLQLQRILLSRVLVGPGATGGPRTDVMHLVLLSGARSTEEENAGRRDPGRCFAPGMCDREYLYE